MDAKFFSSIKKYEKSNTIGFERVPLNIKIVFFGTKKEHTFFGFLHIHFPAIFSKFPSFFDRFLRFPGFSLHGNPILS